MAVAANSHRAVQEPAVAVEKALATEVERVALVDLETAVEMVAVSIPPQVPGGAVAVAAIASG